jgi:hypothetical protein
MLPQPPVTISLESLSVSLLLLAISVHTDDFFVTTVGVYTLKLDATTDVIHAFANDLFMATTNILELSTTTDTVILFSPQPMPC